MLELISIPFVTAIVSVFKSAGLPSKYAPLASLGLGIALAILVLDEPWNIELIGGLVLGLSASGLYSGGKTLITK